MVGCDFLVVEGGALVSAVAFFLPIVFDTNRLIDYKRVIKIKDYIISHLLKLHILLHFSPIILSKLLILFIKRVSIFCSLFVQA